MTSEVDQSFRPLTESLQNHRKGFADRMDFPSFFFLLLVECKNMKTRAELCVTEDLTEMQSWLF
jgi:hypothetical protein